MYYHVALISQYVYGECHRHSPCVVEWSLPVLMIIASTNYQTGHSGVAFATLAACLGVILGRTVAQKIEWGKEKRDDFVRFATAALSSQSALANYDKMNTSNLLSKIFSMFFFCFVLFFVFVFVFCFVLFFFKKENEESMSRSQTKQ